MYTLRGASIFPMTFSFFFCFSARYSHTRKKEVGYHQKIRRGLDLIEGGLSPVWPPGYSSVHLIQRINRCNNTEKESSDDTI